MTSGGILAALLLVSATALGQEYQLRLLAHAQFLSGNHKLGVAAWGVLPNVANIHSLHGLVLCGLVYKNERRWVEFMAGRLVSSDARPSSELDVRFLDGSSNRANVFLEAEYNFRTQKLFLFPSVTVPAQIKGLHLRVGAEADLTVAPRHRVAFIGPRLVIPLSICKRFCRDSSLITAYRFQSDGRAVLRHYVGFSF